MDQAQNDCDEMEKCLKKLGLKDENIYRLTNATRMQAHDVIQKKVTDRLRMGKKSKPEINYLVIFVFAGHGI